MNRILAGGVAVLSLVSSSAFAGGEAALFGALSQVTAPTTGLSLEASTKASTAGSGAKKADRRSDDSLIDGPPTCRRDDECGADERCFGYSNGDSRCMPNPPPTPAPDPSAALLRKGSELYLRDRAVQLREELALGRGPVIYELATIGGLPATRLGQAMRSHRVELVALIGKGNDPQWTLRFLSRVEQLSRECDQT